MVVRHHPGFRVLAAAFGLAAGAATLTAQARASGTLITFLPIVLAVFMYFVTPTYFRPMFENFIGWVLIAIGIFMIFIGNLIIRRVVAIEV